jgi:hypothetical protein
MKDSDGERHLFPELSLGGGPDDGTEGFDLVKRGAVLLREDPGGDLLQVFVYVPAQLAAGLGRMGARGMDSTQNELVADGSRARGLESDPLQEGVEADLPPFHDVA